MKKETTVLQKLHKIEKSKSIYDIHYCNAGVGFCFYEPPQGYTLQARNNDWKQYLNTYDYYPTLEEAIENEFKKIDK